MYYTWQYMSHLTLYTTAIAITFSIAVGSTESAEVIQAQKTFQTRILLWHLKCKMAKQSLKHLLRQYGFRL